MLTKSEAIQACADCVGADAIEEAMQSAVFDSIATGCCRRCGYTTEVEPDSRDGWCEECEAGTVESILILAGLI